ncbi:MAG: helix-turn-helix transcriptional regulator [Pseudomonadota bacterium]
MAASADSTRSDFPVARRDLDPVLGACTEATLERVFREVGQEAALASTDEHTLLPLVDYFRILKILTTELHDETVHLSSRHLMPGATGHIVGSLSSCDTLYEAMKTIARSYNMLHGGSYNHVEQRDGCIVYIVDDRHFPYRLDDSRYIHFTLECVLIFLHCMLVSITPEDLSSRLRKVYTKRDRDDRRSASRHMDFWTVPIRHHSGTYTLMYDASAADLPVDVAPGITPSSQEIYDDVIRVVEAMSSLDRQEHDIVRQVEKAIEKKMFNQAETARYLGCSVATLRRRLQERNSSYRAISKATLNKAALRLLKQGLHASEIAEELGFSDFRSFTRAFKSWNGMTPKQYVQENAPVDRKD